MLQQKHNLLQILVTYDLLVFSADDERVPRSSSQAIGETPPPAGAAASLQWSWQRLLLSRRRRKQRRSARAA